MTTVTIFSAFEDFNDQVVAALAGPEQAELSPPVDTADLHDDSWTDGYLTGCQERSGEGGASLMTAKLLSSLYGLEQGVSEAVDEAALAIADLMISAATTVTMASWSATLMDRVRIVADRIKPALAVAPEFILRDDQDNTYHFGLLSDLALALVDLHGEDVTIRWQRGEAIISRKILLEDLQGAMSPLLAGLVDRQNARQQA